jgi:hypothetical protein
MRALWHATHNHGLRTRRTGYNPPRGASADWWVQMQHELTALHVFRRTIEHLLDYLKFNVIPFSQILNRTNNIFELVTVDAVMHEKAPDKKNELLRLSDETDGATEKNLRLKGKIYSKYFLFSFVFMLTAIHAIREIHNIKQTRFLP